MLKIKLKYIMPKLVVIIILYNPTEENINHILFLQKFNHFIYIYDNSENIKSIFKTFHQFNNIKYFNDGKNEGIPSRLNQGCKLAIEENFDWVMFLDQDTIFTEHHFIDYIARSFNLNVNEPNAFYSAYYVEGYLKNENSNENYCELNCMITSTCLMPLSIYEKIGNFDEKLFIDFTDLDYSIRANYINIKQILIRNINIIHTIGKVEIRSSIKSFFLIKKRKAIHTPIRCYYIIRNSFYLKNKFKKNKIIYNKNVLGGVGGFMLRNLFYGRNFLKYIHFILKGYFDYKKNILGKLK